MFTSFGRFQSAGVSHNSCNIGTRALPDMYALALGHRAYISGNALVPMLQLLDVAHLVNKT